MHIYITMDYLWGNNHSNGVREAGTWKRKILILQFTKIRVFFYKFHR